MTVMDGTIDHMAVADAARARGDVDSLRAALVSAFEHARASGDIGAMTAAALAMPTSQQFGSYAGQIPALLYEAYAVAPDVSTRCRLAAALARSWVYGGNSPRAARFADEALTMAVEVDEPEVTAEALDAALCAHWGPDDFTTRLSLAARLDEVAAHLRNTDLRLGAHLWRLSTAWECLDIVAVQRQLRALDVVADESGSARAAFFAASRRAAYTLATDDVNSADRYIARTAEIGAELAEADAGAVVHVLGAMRLRMAADIAALRAKAAVAEAFAAAEGVPSVSAIAAVLWLDAGHPEQAAVLVTQLATPDVAAIPRDVHFLLTTSCIVAVASAVGLDDIARDGADALVPYAGRGVVNVGAVTFFGVVDDYIARARTALGGSDADRWRGAAQRAYRRIGAGWWERALGAPPVRHASATRTLMLRRDDSGRWTVGAEGGPFSLPDLKGLHYLRLLLERPGVDVEALVLSDAVAGHPGTELKQADAGAVIDDAAARAYRDRLAALDVELDNADARGDQQKAERAAVERDALLEQLRSATGLGGRARQTGTSTERARVAVRKAVAAAIAQIEQQDPRVGRVLRTSIHTGAMCRYEPNPDHPTRWVTR